VTRLLVSVRDTAEAMAAAAAGAGFIDLKDPAAGALGGLPPAAIERIVAVLRSCALGVPVSATIGDLDAAEVGEIVARVERVARCGVDYVKVGIDGDRAEALALIGRLGELARAGIPVVPVLIADDGVDDALVRAALRAHAFPALMLDTRAKRAGSLLERVALSSLAAFVAQVRAEGVLAGLAGALRLDDLPALRALGPDFAGFRSAVCAGGRAGALDASRVRALREGLAADAHAGGLAALAR
jgi:uncharacterized protein (UPF0264 family)